MRLPRGVPHEGDRRDVVRRTRWSVTVFAVVPLLALRLIVAPLLALMGVFVAARMPVAAAIAPLLLAVAPVPIASVAVLLWAVMRGRIVAR
jgi:hypothetical protein